MYSKQVWWFPVLLLRKSDDGFFSPVALFADVALHPDDGRLSGLGCFQSLEPASGEKLTCCFRPLDVHTYVLSFVVVSGWRFGCRCSPPIRARVTLAISERCRWPSCTRTTAWPKGERGENANITRQPSPLACGIYRICLGLRTYGPRN